MITKTFKSGNSQAVRIPKELRLPEGEVSIRRYGDGILVEPCKKPQWPNQFFGQICIDDSQFLRPQQRDTPDISAFD